MSSPFRRHQQKVRAIQSSGASAAPETVAPAEHAEDTPAGQEYAGLRVLLHDNLRTLKDIESHEQRVPKKAEFAGAFADWIKGVLDADQPVQDEILLVNMIWALDYGDLEYMMTLAQFAIRHKLAMPEPFNRSVSCWLREEVAELSLAQPGTVTHGLLVAVDLLTTGADMPDQAKAKLNKALGNSWLSMAQDFDPDAESAPAGGAASYAEQALVNYQRALKLDEKSGVKTAIKTTEKLLKQLAEAAEE